MKKLTLIAFAALLAGTAFAGNKNKKKEQKTEVACTKGEKASCCAKKDKEVAKADNTVLQGQQVSRRDDASNIDVQTLSPSETRTIAPPAKSK